MYKWAVVNNGEITEYHYDVPQNWRHVSNLAASESDTEFMRSVGWHLIEANVPEHDTATHEITAWNYEIVDGGVRATATVSPKPPPSPIVHESQEQRELMDLARLQSELDRWKETLEPRVIPALAEQILRMDQNFWTLLRDSVSITFHQLNAEGRIPGLHNLTEQTVRQEISKTVRDMLTRVSSNDHTTQLESLWAVESQRIREENDRWLSQNQTRLIEQIDHIRQRVTTVVGDLPTLKSDSDVLDAIRWDRNIRLQRTDWTQASDVQSRMSAEDRARWEQYRQALRDVPQIYASTGVLTWPEF